MLMMFSPRYAVLLLMLLLGLRANAETYLEPRNLMLDGTDQYSEMLRTVFRDAYASDSIVQVMIRSSTSAEKVIYVKTAQTGATLFVATASASIYWHYVQENRDAIERQQGYKLQGLDGLPPQGDIRDVTVSLKSRNISHDLYLSLIALWQLELTQAKQSGPHIILDGAEFEYSLHTSQAPPMAGSSSTGVDPRLDNLATIVGGLSLLVDGKRKEEAVFQNIADFNRMSTQ
jgi:hypothetical protein